MARLQDDMGPRRRALVQELGGFSPPPGGDDPAALARLRATVGGFARPMEAGGITGGRMNAPGMFTPPGTPGTGAVEAITNAAVPGGDLKKPDFSQFGQFGHGALNPDKIAAGHDSPKYQIARVLSHFDPRQGITGDVIGALNALGLGTFEGSGDKLRVTGNIDPRFGNVLASDMVRNLDSPEARWGGWGSVQLGGQPAAAPMGGGAPNAGLLSAIGGLDALMQGNPTANIQQALQQVNRPNFQALMAQLSGR